MAALQGTILASKIVPTDSLDTYATHEDKYGRGGHRSADTIVERDEISPERRKEGMTVYVKENKTKYILEGGIENVNWKTDNFLLENALQLLENNKVDKIAGMSLSKNNLTDELKSSIEEIKVKEISLDTVNKKLQVKLTNNNMVNIDINPIVENNTIDNLESTDGSKPLSANQGKILNDSKLDKTGGKLTGPIIGTKEKKVSLGASNNIDLAEGNLFIKNVTGNITFTLSNISAGNDIVHTFILEIVNGGNYTITWFNNIKWDNGTAPTLSTAGTDILSFYTHDKGVTWRGFILAIDSK